MRQRSARINLGRRWGPPLICAALLLGAGCSTKKTLDGKLLQLIEALASYSCENDPLELDLVPAPKLRLIGVVTRELGPLREPVMVGADLQPQRNASTIYLGRYRLRSAKGPVTLEIAVQNELLSDVTLSGAPVDPLLARLTGEGYEDLVIEQSELVDESGAPRATFDPGEAISFRFRLAGLSTERCKARLRVDLTVLDRHDQLLLEQPAYRELQLSYRAEEPPVASFDGSLKGFAPGSYRLQFVLTDELAQHTVTHSLAARVRPTD